MSTTSMAIFSNPLFATHSVYARNASIFISSSLIAMQNQVVVSHTMCAHYM